ncbi:hypothetical protein [Streptomyces sp. KL116D]
MPLAVTFSSGGVVLARIGERRAGRGAAYAQRFGAATPASSRPSW